MDNNSCVDRTIIQNGHGLSLNDTVSSTVIPERSDCMYANAAPQHPAYSGISSSSKATRIPFQARAITLDYAEVHSRMDPSMFPRHRG